MSTTIDSRVVEMRFDNSHFEKNVSTTMSTLDKLKHALHLDGASKGLENINTSVRKVDMSSLSNGVETVRAKFSAMEVVGVTALANITNSAVNTGKNLVKSLSVDQVMSGWNKYGQKTSSVQTIMNATGKSIDEVNEYLAKLMWFSDETSYGFTDMTAALGQMASSGGKIEKLVPLITGVANATAFAGKGASEFSRVMYNLNQSYGAGYLQFMDWKSLELAGVGSKQLKEILIETAIAQKKLSETGKTDKGLKVTTSNFGQTLKERWADTAVMEAAFGRFAEMSELAYEMVQSGEVDTASEAYEILSEKYDGVAITAAKAAQEAKTFTEALDATKDAVSSGWMRTFEAIFGNYEQAKVLWTDLANTLWDVFAAGGEVRNFVIETALSFAKPWKEMEEKLSGITNTVDKIKNAADTVKYFQKVVKEVWRGNWKRSDTGRYQLLEAAGYNHKVVQDLVNLGSRHKITIEDIEASHKKFGLTLETTAEETEKVADAFNNLSDEQLKAAGLTEDEIGLFRALENHAKKTGQSVSELADEMSEFDGRTMLIDSFKNIGGVILDTIQIIKDAFTEIFNPPDQYEMVFILYDLIKKFKEFTESLRLTNKETGELTEAGEKFSRIFKGIFAAVDLVVTILKGPFKFVFETFSKILKTFGLTFLDIFAAVGDAIVNFRDGVDKVIGGLTTFIADHVSKWIDKFKETEFFKTVAGWFKDAGDSISTAVGGITSKFETFNSSGLGKALTAFLDLIGSIGKKIGDSAIFKTFVGGITTAFGTLKDFFTGFKLPEFTIENVKKFLTDFVNLGNFVSANKNGSLSGVVTGVGRFLDTKTWAVNLRKIPVAIFEKLATFWIKTGDLLKKAFEKGKELAAAIKEFLFGTQDVNLQVIMDTVTKFLWIITLIKTIQMLSAFVAPLNNVTSALDNVASSLKWNAISGAFKSLALALAAFAVCIVVIASMPDMNKAWQAAGMLAGLMIIMGGVVTAMGIIAGKFKGGMDSAAAAASLLALMGSLVLLVYAIKEIDKLTINDPAKTFSVLFGALLAMTAGVWMVSKAGGSSFKSVAAIATLLAALKLLLDIITAYDEYDWTGKQRAINKMMEMLLGLSVAIAIASGGPKASGNAKGLAFTILAMVVSLKLLLGAIEDFAAMDDDTLARGGLVVATLLGGLTLMAVALSRANKGKVLEKGQKSVNNFTGLAVALLAVVAAVWLFGKMDSDTLIQGGIATASALVLFAIILSSIGKACKGIKMGSITLMLAGMGLLIVGMYHIIKQMQEIPWQSSVSSSGALIGLMLAMAATLRIITAHNYGMKRIFKWVLALTALTALVAALAGVLYMLRNVSPANSIANAVALGVLLAVMAGVLKNLVPVVAGFDSRKLSYKKMAKVGTMLAGLTVVLYALVGVLALMNGVVGTNAISNAIALSVLLAVLVEVAKRLIPAMTMLDSRKLTYQKMVKIGTMLAGLTVVLYALAGVLALMNGVNGVNAIGNAVALGLLLSVLAGVMVVLEKFQVKFNGGAVAAIAILSAVLYVLVGVLYAMEDIDPVAALPRILALSVLLAAVVAATVILEKFKVKFNGGAVAAIAILSAVLYELVGVLALMKYVDPEGLLPKVTALSALLAVVVGVLLVLNTFKVKFNGGAVAAMSLLALVMAELAGVMIIANHIETDGAMTRMLALSALLGVIAGVLLVLNTFKVGFNGKSVAAMALLGLVLAELAGVMILANKIDADGAITRVKALSILMSVLTVLLLPLTLVGALAVQAITGVGVLAVLATSLLILVGVLALMDGIENAMANAKTLSLLATVLTLLLIPLTIIGAFIVPAIAGVGAIAVLMTSLLIVVGVLALMEGLENAQANTKLLIELLGALTTTLVVISVMAPLAGAGVIALAALTTLVGKIALFIVAIGGLMEYFPQIEKFVNNGVGLFKKLFQGVGEMISAFGVGLTSGLPDIAKNLSDFATNLGTFIKTVDSVSEDTVTKAGLLGEAVFTLIKGDFVSCLKQLFSKDFAGNSLTTLGTELSNFGTNAGDFISAMNELKPETATTMSAFASAIKDLNDVCGDNNLTNGNLTAFGEGMKGYAACIKDVAINVSGIADTDVENVQRAAKAGEALADLNECIPSSGGIWQEWTGEKSLSTWGTTLSAFADSIVAFSTKVSGKTVDKTAIENAASAGQAMADLNDAIPSSGGIWQEWTGEKNLGTWGSTLGSFGQAIVDYSAIVSGKPIDAEAIKNSATAAGYLVEVVNKLKPTDGTWQEFWGQIDAAGFGSGLTAIGTGLADYATSTSTLDESTITNIQNSGKAIDEIVAVVNKIPKTGGTASWFGDHDPYAFGSGVTALATGITDFCTAAATVDQADLDAIAFTQKAVDALEAVVTSISEEISTVGAQRLATASEYLKHFCQDINTISTGEYDYSGIETIKTQIAKMQTMFEGIDVSDLEAKALDLKAALANVANCANTLSGLAGLSYGGVDTLAGAINSLADANVDGVISAFSGKGESMSAAVTSMVNAMSTGLSSGATTVSTSASNLANAAVDAVSDKKTEFSTIGELSGANYNMGISANEEGALTAGTALGAQAAAGARTGYSGMSSAGAYVVTGFAAGITANTYLAEAKARAMANAAEKAAKAALDINSPSKVFRAIGYSVPEGFAMGIDKMSGMADKSSAGMAQGAIDNVSDSIARISKMVSSDIDAQPTIRPVLDLTDVENGTATLGSMLNMGSRVGVSANLGAISSMMNLRSQNGVNADVVAAIDKLNKRMDNLGNTTYQVNGITYDDGSNISNAVATLVRAAKIERRV